MRTQQTGMGVFQLLLVAATIAAVTFVIRPGHQASLEAQSLQAEKVKVAEALDYAVESKRKIARSFIASHSLPRTAGETEAMRPALASKPEFVRDVKFQPDFAGENIMIMVYLDDGVVENLLGGEQYIYIAGIKSGESPDTLEWQCGARNVDLNLLPENCRS